MNIHIDSSTLIILCLAALAGIVGWKLDAVITAFKKPKKAKKNGKTEVGAEVLAIDDSKEVTQPGDVNMYDEDAIECIVRDIDTPLTDRVADACRRAATQRVRLHLILNTYGGNTDAAYAINGVLAYFQSQGNELRIIVRGVCQSAGVIILMAAPPEYRYAVHGSEFMMHVATRTSDGSRDTYTRQIDAGIVDAIANGSRIEKPSLARHFESGKDCHVNVEQAVKFGLVSGTI